MTFPRGMMSPGPSWTVLAQPASSSPSTRTSIRSELDTDVDMGDDEAEHEPDPISQPPIPKRKALPDADSPSARRHKQPRLDVNGTTTTSPSRHAVPSRTQPGPPRLRSAASLTQSADSASTSDFPNTITERVQRVLGREREDRERQRRRERANAETLRTTARKQTTHPKNVRKVTTASLLKNAQTSTVDESVAWTRVRPKLKPKRTNFDAETAATRPLAVARQRDSDVIELTDSSDSTRRRPRPSMVRPTALANTSDLIVITSDSEEDGGRAMWGTQWRRSGPQVQRPRRAPPPADVEVISLTDSDEGLPPPATARASLPSVPGPGPTTVPMPLTAAPRIAHSIPETASMRLFGQSSLQDAESSRTSTPPSYDPPPDDLDDTFGNLNFGTGDDPNPPDDWDGLGVGTSLATIPVAVPSSDAAPAGTRASEGAGDGEDALFNSYLNMDQMTDEGAPPGGDDGRDKQPMEDENAPVSTPEVPFEDSPEADGRDKDTHMRDLEEGEVDPNDMTFVRAMESGEILSQEQTARVRSSMRIIGTPESGEIKSQGSGSGSRPPSSAPSTGSVVTTPPSTSTPAPAPQSSSLTSSSASPHLPPSQPVRRIGTMVMPDLSLYERIRYKRPQQEVASIHPLYSRGGTGRSGEVPATVAEKKARNSPLTAMDAPSRVDEVRSASGDADMQVDAVASASNGVSTLSPEQSAEASPDPQDTIQAQKFLATEASRVIDDAPPPSTQPAPISIRETLFEPPATQPASSSSRPIIAPPRIPRPSTPVSLVDVLNEVRRDKLLKDERQLARKRSMADITAERATPAKSASHPASSTPSLPVPPSTRMPTSSQPQATRMLGKVPSLKDIRELLAKRNVLSPSARPPSTSNEDMGQTPAKSPIVAPAQSRSLDMHGGISPKTSVLDTPTSVKTVSTADSGPGTATSTRRQSEASPVPAPASVTVHSKSVESSEQKNSVLDVSTPAAAGVKWRVAPSTPFEAFISPARPLKRSDKAWLDEGSPTVLRPRMSTGMLAPRVRKDRERDRRRMSAAAMFEAYIVRDSPRRVEREEMDKGDGNQGVDSGSEKVQHVELQVSETERTERVESAEVPERELDGANAVDDARETPERELDHGGDDVNGVPSRESDEEGDADVATHVNEGEAGGEVDETDALLELASVHLSQTNLDAEEEAAVMPESTGKPTDQGDVDMLDELPAAHGFSPKMSHEMVVDGPPDDDAMDEETDPPPGLVDVPETWSYGTTPDLILPEDPQPPTSQQNNNFGQAHERHISGDSVEECDALLEVPRDAESESEESSSKTASSTSLVPPRVRSRQRSPPVHSSDILHLAALVPDESDRCEHRIVTFESRVAEERDRPPEYKLAKDIPHSLQDYVNQVLSESYRKSENARETFEGHILESMGSEPDTPPIKIFDNNIGEDLTPAWEFHYTNEMWFGEEVPPPDRKGLIGCGCVGKCDPKSRTCLCAKRQLKWVQKYIDGEYIPATWPGSPFVYDHKGLLQRLECPIFECNRFCACDEDCLNRVVQNGRKWPVHITRTKDKGWGVVAGDKKIPKGSYLGIYAGELLTEKEGEARGHYYDKCGRTYLFSIDFHHLKLDMEDPEAFENLYVVDAYHAGNFTRFLNHSCDPNCAIIACYIDDADINKPLLAIFTTRDVEPWEELCFSYYGDIEEKREEIQRDGLAVGRDQAVYSQCRCGADNCIGRYFG